MPTILPEGDSVRVKDDYDGYVELINTNNAVIIKALDVFQGLKLIFQDLETQQTYVFNVSSNNAKSPRHVRIITPNTNDKKEESLTPKGGAYIALTQHASTSLYYPERYKPNTEGVNQVNVKKAEANYFVTFNAKAEPVGSWKGFGYFVSAVKITNLEENKVELDPRIHFRGDWLFLSSQHSWVGSKNDKYNNVTTVYVISKRPFWEALL